MGGDSYCSSPLSTEDVSLSGQDFPHEAINSSGDEASVRHNKLENGSVIKGVRVSAAERQRSKVYAEVLRSYEDLQPRIDRLEEVKNKILSYTPGSWAEKADLSERDRPNATSLLLIGPTGSGKSSLVNKISQLFEDNIFLPGRAQVSCNSSSTGGGTCFLREYMVPRGSGSFCLYDTRGLSVDSSENQKMSERWMTRGVHHGELITRASDCITLKARLKCKARRSFFSSQGRPIDFVIFVVNGLSVLESLNSADEKKKKEYSQMIATNFNNPWLSFKDDKPAIAVTHGDLLPLSDRVRVRVYLGELLGVPPTGQIFDIPEDNDPATTLAVFDMLVYCLERADRNLPAKDIFVVKVRAVAGLLFWIIAAMVVVFGFPGVHRNQPREQPTPPFKLEWHKIRHLWFE